MSVNEKVNLVHVEDEKYWQEYIQEELSGVFNIMHVSTVTQANDLMSVLASEGKPFVVLLDDELPQKIGSSIDSQVGRLIELCETYQVPYKVLSTKKYIGGFLKDAIDVEEIISSLKKAYYESVGSDG